MGFTVPEVSAHIFITGMCYFKLVIRSRGANVWRWQISWFKVISLFCWLSKEELSLIHLDIRVQNRLLQINYSVRLKIRFRRLRWIECYIASEVMVMRWAIHASRQLELEWTVIFQAPNSDKKLIHHRDFSIPRCVGQQKPQGLQIE